MLFGGELPHVSRHTANGQVVERQGKVAAIVVVGGSAATNVALYDDTSATGDPIFEAVAPIDETSPLISFADVQGIAFDTGLYLDITTTGGAVYVWYI